MIKIVKQTGLDSEWVKLLQEAKKIGITTEEVRSFLSESKKDETINH